MKTKRFLLLLATTAITGMSLAEAPADDPFIWLEQAHSERAMQWVEAENAKTSAALEGNPLFSTLFNDAKTIAEAEDRIPVPSIIGGRVFNFWQDGNHEHGIWRHASLPDYQGAAPQWRTVLDLDALSKAEKGNWFWKGSVCQEPREQRCRVRRKLRQCQSRPAKYARILLLSDQDLGRELGTLCTGDRVNRTSTAGYLAARILSEHSKSGCDSSCDDTGVPSFGE